MPDADLTRLPTGEMSWAALVAYAAESDDRVERYFLEVKSDVDLTSKRGRAKVAKFILGAANRDPDLAARRFGGHAILMLGVGGGQASGIDAFEAKELARDVRRLVGADGPTWDFERISTGTAKDIIAVVVDPPTGDVWTCRADGDGLADGDICVRGDGDTRKATGDEIRVMLSRAASKKPSVEVDVEVLGAVHSVSVNTQMLTEWIEAEATAYRAQVATQPSAYSGLAVLRLTAGADTRSTGDFLSEVEKWKTATLANPTAGVVEVAARVFPGIRVRVSNRTRTFMRDVRIDIAIGDETVAADWLDPNTDARVDFFPDRPVAWGKQTFSTLLAHNTIGRVSPMTHAGSRHGSLDIKEPSPPLLTMAMESLRPEEVHLSDDDEVVLVLIGSHEATGPVTGQWRLTAAGINDVFEGQFTLTVEHRDWSQPKASFLTPPEEDEESE